MCVCVVLFIRYNHDYLDCLQMHLVCMSSFVLVYNNVCNSVLVCNSVTNKLSHVTKTVKHFARTRGVVTDHVIAGATADAVVNVSRTVLANQ